MATRIAPVFAVAAATAATLLFAFGIATERSVAAAPSQANQKVEINGNALGFGTIGAGQTQPIQIIIEKWSAPADRDKLISTFAEKKQDGLLDLLRDMKEIGRWRFPGYMGPDPQRIYTLGTPIKYAASQPLQDGGRRVVIMTDRIISFQENRDKPRSIDYPFTLMEMHFDKSGQGEGKMAWFTQINFDKAKKAIELQYYSSEPVRLNNLKIENRK
jgi:hypothetical protein